MQQTGKYLIVLGIVLLIVGVIIYFWGDKLNWFGNLPGDIKINKGHFKFYAPVASMILLSALITLLFWIFNKIK